MKIHFITDLCRTTHPFWLWPTYGFDTAHPMPESQKWKAMSEDERKLAFAKAKAA